jgi:endo-1,4-beta-xylanase
MAVRLMLVSLASVLSVRALPADLALLYGPPRPAPATAPFRVIPPPLNATQTLREAASAAGIHIGAAINYGGMHGSFGPNYTATALREFDLFTAENECKVGPVHPLINNYSFAQCDYIISTANLNASLARMHNYCWHTENPDWLNAMSDPSELRLVLASHIGNMTAHYLDAPGGGALAYYAVDVVNEAVSDGGANVPLFKNAKPWYPAVSDYVEVAFKAAATANAERALLCYNDYGAEGWSSAKAQRVVSLIKLLKAAGVPVNCVGLQMHISVDNSPTAADISENIRQLGLLGQTVHITEMDVKCPRCDATRLQAQAQVYADVLGACLANTNCKSFETWGIFDGDTWIPGDLQPLLFDAQWAPKPAYTAVLSTLQHHAAALR